MRLEMQQMQLMCLVAPWLHFPLGPSFHRPLTLAESLASNFQTSGWHCRSCCILLKLHKTLRCWRVDQFPQSSSAILVLLWTDFQQNESSAYVLMLFHVAVGMWHALKKIETWALKHGVRFQGFGLTSATRARRQPTWGGANSRVGPPWVSRWRIIKEVGKKGCKKCLRIQQKVHVFSLSTTWLCKACFLFWNAFTNFQTWFQQSPLYIFTVAPI